MTPPFPDRRASIPKRTLIRRDNQSGAKIPVQVNPQLLGIGPWQVKANARHRPDKWRGREIRGVDEKLRGRRRHGKWRRYERCRNAIPSDFHDIGLSVTRGDSRAVMLLRLSMTTYSTVLPASASFVGAITSLSSPAAASSDVASFVVPSSVVSVLSISVVAVSSDWAG